MGFFSLFLLNSKFGYGTLISIIIAVFTIISTIYPLIVTSDKTNNNINRDIIILRNNLSLKYHEVPFKNFDDYQDISLYFKNSNNKKENYLLFLSILAYREGKILEEKNQIENSIENNSMEYYLQSYIDKVKLNHNNTFYIEHNHISWYPLRQLILEKEYNALNINIHELKEPFTKPKLEDIFCNDLTKNSIIIDTKKDKINYNIKETNSQYTSFCSKQEIKKIIEYAEKYPYVINIMNDNLDNKLLNLTQNFRLLLNYFGLFIFFSFIAGPIAYILWIRNYIIQ